jgi:chromosome segregation ATPase
MIRNTLLLLLACLGAVSLPARSAGDEEAIRQLRLQVRQSMQMARDAQQAAAAAEAEASAAQAEQAALGASLMAAEQARGALAATAAQLRREREALGEKLAALEQALAEARSAHQQTRDALAAQTGERERAEGQLRQSQAALATCRDHNGQLADAAQTLLDAYQDKGVFAVLGEHEPFTGIGRVRLENLLETYRDRLEAATEPSAPATAAAPAAGR